MSQEGLTQTRRPERHEFDAGALPWPTLPSLRDPARGAEIVGVVFGGDGLIGYQTPWEFGGTQQ